MKTLIPLSILAFIAIVGIAFAQSTSTSVYPGFLSVATTGSAACPSGTQPPCFIPYSATNPLPTTTSGGH